MIAVLLPKFHDASYALRKSAESSQREPGSFLPMLGKVSSHLTYRDRGDAAEAPSQIDRGPIAGPSDNSRCAARQEAVLKVARPSARPGPALRPLWESPT
jgi:hypothetical protein